MKEFDENQVIVTKNGSEYQAEYNGQFAFGKSKEDAVNKVRKFYFESLIINIIEKNKQASNAHSNSQSFTWTGLFAYLALVGLLINIVILAISRTNFWISLLSVSVNILSILVLFELKGIVEMHE